MDTHVPDSGTAPAPWPELDAAALRALDGADDSFEILRQFIAGEFEGRYDEAEMRVDFAELVTMLQKQHKDTVGTLYTVCKRYDRLWQGFNTLLTMGPDSLRRIQSVLTGDVDGADLAPGEKAEFPENFE